MVFYLFPLTYLSWSISMALDHIWSFPPHGLTKAEQQMSFLQLLITNNSSQKQPQCFFFKGLFVSFSSLLWKRTRCYFVGTCWQNIRWLRRLLLFSSPLICSKWFYGFLLILPIYIQQRYFKESSIKGDKVQFLVCFIKICHRIFFYYCFYFFSI